MAVIVIHFDGSCEPINPGGVGTFGWTITGVDELPNGLSQGGFCGEGPGMTNNAAEYTALGKALRCLADNPAMLQPGDTLLIRGDSQLTIKTLTGAWQLRVEHLAKLRGRCFELLEQIGCEWSAEWIPREQNAEADALAVAAYEEFTGNPYPKHPERRKRA